MPSSVSWLLCWQSWSITGSHQKPTEPVSAWSYQQQQKTTRIPMNHKYLLSCFIFTPWNSFLLQYNCTHIHQNLKSREYLTRVTTKNGGVCAYHLHQDSHWGAHILFDGWTKDKEYESDPGIIIVYSDESNVRAALSLPEANAIPSLCSRGTVLNYAQTSTRNWNSEPIYLLSPFCMPLA